MGCASSSEDIAMPPTKPTRAGDYVPSAHDADPNADDRLHNAADFAHADPALARADAAANAPLTQYELAQLQRFEDEWSVESGGDFTDEPSPFVLGARTAKAVMLARFKYDINDDADQFAAEPEPAECIAESTALAETWLEEIPHPSATFQDDTPDFLAAAQRSTESDLIPAVDEVARPQTITAADFGDATFSLPHAVHVLDSVDALDELPSSGSAGDDDSGVLAMTNNTTMMRSSFSLLVQDDSCGILTSPNSTTRLTQLASTATPRKTFKKLTAVNLRRHASRLAETQQKPTPRVAQ